MAPDSGAEQRGTGRHESAGPSVSGPGRSPFREAPMSNTTNMVERDAEQFLRRHEPFDRMEGESLAFLVSRLKLAFYPKGSVLLDPEHGAPPHLFIVRDGSVLRREVSELPTLLQLTGTLGGGDCFPLGAVMGQRPSTNRYVAIDDVSCYLLPADDYLRLLQMSQVFSLYCTRYIAGLFNQSRQQLRLQYAQRASEQQTMSSPIETLLKREPASVPQDTPIGAVLERMVGEHIGSMIVSDGEGKPLGIFTQSDVARRIVLPKVALDRPISEVMSASPHVIPVGGTVYDAAMAMAMHGIRHVVVVDAVGRLRGIVSERDLFAIQRVGLRQIRQAIESAPDLEVLKQTSGDVRQLAINMLAQGVGSEQLTQFISSLNDALTRRVIELNLARHDLAGIEWAWLSFGSEGRDEQTFSTDQDNGIIFVCPQTSDRERLTERFLAFAKEVNRDLDACGFPYCKGNIMASNPEWCLTLEAWQEKFSRWVRAPDPTALLNATIFFDFRALYGENHLADRLRSWLFTLTQPNTIFLRMLAVNALTVDAPLGRFRDFVTDGEKEDAGTIDLKTSGARLFVDAARVYSLATGTPNTNTQQRLRTGCSRAGLQKDEIAAMIESFNFIQQLRLRNQHLQAQAGREPNNRVRPDDLNELDRHILKEAFKQARKLQARLRMDYHV
jgi:CBS domain-containing protein